MELVKPFFDAYSLQSAKLYISSSFKAAETSKVWNNGAPYDLIYFFEHLSKLVHALHKWVKRSKKKATNVVIKNLIQTYSIKQWDTNLNYILCYALSKHSFFEASVDLAILHFYEIVNQLIENAYLIIK